MNINLKFNKSSQPRRLSILFASLWATSPSPVPFPHKPSQGRSITPATRSYNFLTSLNLPIMFFILKYKYPHCNWLWKFRTIKQLYNFSFLNVCSVLYTKYRSQKKLMPMWSGYCVVQVTALTLVHLRDYMYWGELVNN